MKSLSRNFALRSPVDVDAGNANACAAVGCVATRFPFFVNRPSALERAVRQSPKSRRLRLEPLENRALLAVDSLGVSAFLADSDVGESWGPDPEPVYSASQLATESVVDATSPISLADLNAVPYGPYVTSEQAALIALRSNATLADETLADFGAIWNETDETTFVETEIVETTSVIAERATVEAEPELFDLGEIEQEPLPGDASLMSVQSRASGAWGIELGASAFLCAPEGNASGGTWDICIPEQNGSFTVVITKPNAAAQFTLLVDQQHANDWRVTTVNSTPEQITLKFTILSDAVYETSEVSTITFASGATSFGNIRATLVNSPEFISDVDRKNGTQAEITQDKTVHWFDTSDFADIGTSFIIQEDINYASNFLLTYSHQRLDKELPQGDAMPVEYLVSNGKMYYRNEIQQGDRCGSVTLKFTAAYDANLSSKDELTLTLEWADVNKAKELLNSIAKGIVATCQSSQRSCAGITGQVLEELAAARVNVLNVKYAVESIELYPPADGDDIPQDPCGCRPHQVVRVKFKDQSTEDYDVVSLISNN